MLRRLAFPVLVAALVFSSLGAAAEQKASAKKKPRNVIIFIADGLRYGSVNATDTPTLLAIRQQGVNFTNSHAMFPTFTTPNASAIATGHYLGDTGDFSNTIYSGYPVFNSGNFGKTPGTVTPFVENDQILGDIDDHYAGNWLTEESLLALVRSHGYNTATIGKVGPAAIQDVTQVVPVGGAFQVPQTVIIDDVTGTSAGVPLSPAIINALTAAGLATSAPPRSNGCAATAQCNNGFSGNNTTPGTTSPNTVQQQYFADTVTKAVLPTFVASGKPFALVFWSRDPDGTQHNQGDSLNTLTPGINGPTSKAGVHNADSNLAQILAYINSNPELANNTDIFITADHGFATISKHEVNAAGASTTSYAASLTYKDSTGRVEVNPGFLPVGFIAIDIAHALNLSLYDPDSIITDGTGHRVYMPVDPTIPQQTATLRQHPASGDGLIGGTGQILDSTDAKVIVAANGGSDLIYIPDHNHDRLRQVVAFLAKQDYVGGIFVDDSFGAVPGALPLSSINLVGSTSIPKPSIAITFKTFLTTPGNLLTAVQVADSALQEGQGMHGSLGRDNTFNNMAAIGPDFKHHYVDPSPISNADITQTIAHVLGLKLPSVGNLEGRVLHEALVNGPKFRPFQHDTLVSGKANGKSTVLRYQRAGRHLYFDEACFVEKVGYGSNPCE